MNCKSLFVLLAAALSTSANPYTDSLWVVGAEGYPGDLVTVEVWLQYQGFGANDSIRGFDILLSWDAAVCSVEGITIGPDFIDSIPPDWYDASLIDNAGVNGSPPVSKILVSAHDASKYRSPVEGGTHLAATADVRILDNTTPGVTTYIDTLMKGFYPPRNLEFYGRYGTWLFTPSYSGGSVVVTSLAGDVKPVSILSPPSVVFVDSLYLPAAAVRNFGPDSLMPFPVICVIGSWADTAVTPIIPGLQATTVGFSGWTPPTAGFFSVTVISQYPDDTRPDNDTLSAEIQGHLLGDVAPTSVVSPPDSVYLGNIYTPSALITNLAHDPVNSVPVICVADSWADTVEIDIIPETDSVVVEFRNWTVTDTGAWLLTVYTHHPADTVAFNDTISKELIALPPEPVPTDSLWVVTAGGSPGQLVPVEVWLQYEGSGTTDSMSGFDILLTWDATVCTAEAITIGTDFIDGVGRDWVDQSQIDNGGWEPPGRMAKLALSAYTLWGPMVERGVHLVATIDFRIVDSVVIGDSTYVDTLMEAFSPPLYLGVYDMHGWDTYVPVYTGGWILAATPDDVGPTSIISPPSDVVVSSTYSPSASVRNFSADSLGPVPVVCTIGPWEDSLEIAQIPPLGSVVANFDSWTPPEPGIHSVTVVSRYPQDANPANDTLSIDVRAYLGGDVGVESILYPPDTVLVGSVHAPSVMLRNFGADSAGPVPVLCRIDSGIDTLHVPSVSGMNSVVVYFPDWAVADTGIHSIIAFSQYPADTNTTNDSAEKDIRALMAPGDVSPLSVLGPPDSVYLAFSYNPAATLVNHGRRPAGPILAVCQIDGWTDTTVIGGIRSLDTVQVFFDEWTVPDTGTYSVTIFTAYPVDTNSANDTIFKSVVCAGAMYYDLLWIGGAEGLPGELVTVELWLQYEGGGPHDSISAFDIPLTWNADVCTAEAITIEEDFGSWTDQSRIDNSGTDGPPAVPKIGASALPLGGGPFGDPFVERGKHLAATIDFRILSTAAPGDSTYIDTLLQAFSPPIFLGFVDKAGIVTYLPGYSGGWVVVGGVGLEELLGEPPLPSIHALSGSYPNPADGLARISFQVATSCHLDLRIYDSSGRLMKVLIDRAMEPGYYVEIWDRLDDFGQELPGGIYFCRFETPEFSSTKKIVLLR